MARIELSCCNKCNKPLFVCRCISGKPPRIPRMSPEQEDWSDNAKWTCICGQRTSHRERHQLVHKNGRWNHSGCVVHLNDTIPVPDNATTNDMPVTAVIILDS